MTSAFDLAIIGGGINGAGIARDAAGRGLSVMLLEQADLGGATSSASTKLIHGGLRYLEHYAFRLVREALAEREVLLHIAPHIIRPLRFVLPHHAGLRPRWLIRAGLFLYDHLDWTPRTGTHRLLPPTDVLDLRHDPAGAPLRDTFAAAFEYSDCWVDDARLVVLNARDAAARGADIRPRTKCLSARAAESGWTLALSDGSQVRAKALVNAAGPWVSQVLEGVVGQSAPSRIRMVKGAHIVLPRLFAHGRGYLFQNADGRVVFAIPYERDFTLIGTTDSDYVGDPAAVAASDADAAYLCAAVGAYLKQPVDPGSVVWRYAGVRPLRDDGTSKAQEATRDYVLELSGTSPLLSVFGGKITTYRRLAEAALDRLRPFFPALPGRWTAGAALPGGDFPWNGAAALQADLLRRYPFLPETTAERLVRCYGTLAPDLLADAESWAELGQTFGADLTAREVDYLIRHEWARSAEDILWRRGKFGLRMTAEQTAGLAAHLG